MRMIRRGCSRISSSASGVAIDARDVMSTGPPSRAAAGAATSASIGAFAITATGAPLGKFALDCSMAVSAGGPANRETPRPYGTGCPTITSGGPVGDGLGDGDALTEGLGDGLGDALGVVGQVAL